MRWKEKFLVPNHLVQDISGASFAGQFFMIDQTHDPLETQTSGFYYVCVDFDPPAKPFSSHTPSVSNPVAQVSTIDRGGSTTFSSVENRRNNYGDPMNSRNVPLSSKAAVATMNGFYYHQNSEP